MHERIDENYSLKSLYMSTLLVVQSVVHFFGLLLLSALILLRDIAMLWPDDPRFNRSVSSLLLSSLPFLPPFS